MKKSVAVLLSSILIFTNAVAAFGGEPLTKGEYAKILEEQADSYNPNVKAEDLIKNKDTLNNKLTKIEALAMLERAFGDLPELKGDLKRTAPDKVAYNDVPFWAEDSIKKLSDAGVLSEGADNNNYLWEHKPNGTKPDDISVKLGSGEYVDTDYTDTMARRMYRLFGTSYKDDFYTAVNKGYLDESVVNEGYDSASAFYDISVEVNKGLTKLLLDIISEKHEQGTPEQQVRDFFFSAYDEDTRNQIGIKPIEPVLKALREAKSDSDLEKISLAFAKETTQDLLIGLSVASTLENSKEYVLVLQGYSLTLNKEDYKENSKKLKAFESIIKRLLVLGGNDEETADKKTTMIIDFEKELLKYTKDKEYYSQVENSYNYISLSEAKAMFKTFDVEKVARVHSFDIGDKILVVDKDVMSYYGSLFDNKHTELLSVLAEVSLLFAYSDMLNQDFLDVHNDFTELVNGYNPKYTIRDKAYTDTMEIMSTQLNEAFVNNALTQKEKEDVESIAKNIIKAYESRIEKLDWLSEETKVRAKEKLEAINVVVGSPEGGDTGLSIDIKPYKKGEDYYIQNLYSMLRAADEKMADLLRGDYKVENINFQAYEVNASYYGDFNTIVIPAGILSTPVYDINNSPELKYGGIGYIIGHEISHAFDPTGALFDKNGNYKNWWTEQDRKNYNELISSVVDYYNEAETATGIKTSGILTRDENIADLAGVEAAVDALELVKKKPDYKAFFTNYAKCLRYTAARSVLLSSNINDSHSAGYVRVNYVLKNVDEFYTAFDIKEGDGMFIPQDERIKIW